MPSLARGARSVEINERCDFHLKRIFGREKRLAVIGYVARHLEVDVHDGRCVRGIGGCQLGERALRPFCGLLGVIQIEINAIGSTLATERL